VPTAQHLPPPHPSEVVASAHGRVAGLISSGADPSRIEQAKAELAEAVEAVELHKQIESIVARAGKLTPEQIERLRSLLPDPSKPGRGSRR
jgi:hypothetical protein